MSGCFFLKHGVYY